MSAEQIRQLARLFATTKGAGIYQGACTQNQMANGTQSSRAISVLQVITGNINVPGGWTISMRLAFGNVSLKEEGEPLGADQFPLFFEVWDRKSPSGVVTVVPESIPDKIKAFYPAIETITIPIASIEMSRHPEARPPEPEAEIGPETAKKYKIENLDTVIIKTNRGQVAMKARVDERIAERVVFVPHGWPEGANANLLTDVTCREPIMGYPDQKSLQCSIQMI